jgi:hypothetical protein
LISIIVLRLRLQNRINRGFKDKGSDPLLAVLVSPGLTELWQGISHWNRTNLQQNGNGYDDHAARLDNCFLASSLSECWH